MLAALNWVKHGAAKAVPIKEDLAAEGILNENGEEEEEEKMEENEEKNPKEKALLAAKAAKLGEDDELAEYNLDNYDEEEDFTVFDQDMNDDFGQIEDDEEDEEDIDDITIRETDAILLGVHTDEEMSHLDMYIYESSDDNLYVHHDIMLPSHPLCVEWLDFHSKNTGENGQHLGNLAAVGTFEPEIEIWDMDVLNAIEPIAVLGGEQLSQSFNSGKKLKNKKKTSNDGHESAVIGLAWNKLGRNFLASCSADQTIKLWDLSKNSCMLTMKHHNDKVQAIQWHPVDATVLLSGSFDRTVHVADVRNPQNTRLSKLQSDVECLQWNTHSPQYFFVSTEDGNVVYYDVRALDKPVWTLNAHTKPTAALSYNQLVPNLFATSSPDKAVKFWSIAEGHPKLIYADKVKFPVFTMSWYQDKSQPYLLALGGEGKDSEDDDLPGRMAVWNTLSFPPIAQAKF